MPIHDWTKVDAGTFHAFHTHWIPELSKVLNRDVLGPDYYALPEQVGGEFIPDVLTLKLKGPGRPSRKGTRRPDHSGGTAVADAPPRTAFHISDHPNWYNLKKSRVVVRHTSGNEMVAVIEIVSPGNKSGTIAFGAFVKKARELLTAGIHLLVVDLFPPTRRDPHGIHPAIWGDDEARTFRFDKARPLTAAAYLAAPGPQAFIEPLAVGDALPDLPLFLTSSVYVVPPLEETYQEAFAALPEYVREQVALKPKRKRK
jgi:hypothetical protein